LPVSSRQGWSYPEELQDPWYEAFVSMVAAMDASAYSAREDRNTILMGGGTVSLAVQAGRGTLTWTQAIEILAADTGFKWVIPAGSVVLDDGQMLYVALVRAPTANLNLALAVTSTLPINVGVNDFFVLGVFRTDRVYFRNGDVLEDGQSVKLFSSGGSGEVPALVGVKYAVLMESPVGTKAWRRPTGDMVLAAFAINSFALSQTPLQTEIGSSVQDPQFTAAYNRNPSDATIDDGGGPVNLAAPYTSFGINASYSKNTINATQLFTLSAKDADSLFKTTQVSIAWRPKVYYGVAAPPQNHDANFITGTLGGQNNTLASARQRTLALNAANGQKIYYAFPQAFGGAAGNFIDDASGLAAGFVLVATVALTNNFGITLPYSIWASEQTGLGAQSVTVF